MTNVKIIVADISDFEMEDQFDRVISIGMFEVCDYDAYFKWVFYVFVDLGTLIKFIYLCAAHEEL